MEGTTVIVTRTWRVATKRYVLAEGVRKLSGKGCFLRCSPLWLQAPALLSSVVTGSHYQDPLLEIAKAGDLYLLRIHRGLLWILEIRTAALSRLHESYTFFSVFPQSG
ncbi:unnamed protein product [Pipistrellus nathusii]|uniref:Uncharacterized protein n=1 Tax=Pipistrellus nathusii TaxID=59473 RepID=A0ABN9ZLK5_PIPNA